MTDKMPSETIRENSGYSVNKKSWTRSDHQKALFCRALEGFPELYDVNNSHFNDIDKVEDSWKKLAVLRKRIYGADEAKLKTTKELQEIWVDMCTSFRIVFFEVCDKMVDNLVLPFEINLKNVLTLGDERLSYFSHMTFTVVAEAEIGCLMLQLPGLKVIQWGREWLVVHPDGKKEILHDLASASRKRLAKEVKDFYDDFPGRMRNVKDRKEAVVMEVLLANVNLVREIAKLNLDSDDDED